MTTRVSPRAIIAIIASFLVLGAAVWAILASRETSVEHTNVILISIDTCRADHLSCYGYAREITPNIDQIASDGTLFARAHSTNPITLPAHSSMLTGTNPPFHGVHNNHNYRLGEENVTLAEMMKGHGYRTAGFVSTIVLEASYGLDQGFDVYREGEHPNGSTMSERRAEATTRDALQWVGRNAEHPFFLFVHYFDPHVPYAPPEPFASRYADNPYAGEISYVDECIGRLTKGLKDLGLYDSSLIIITSDHGEGLGEHREATHSFFVYQSTIRVPLIFRGPGVARSTRVEQPVSIIDIPPTVLGLLDLPSVSELHGTDLSPWVSGGGGADDRHIYCESLVPMEYGCSPLRSVIAGQWKYIWAIESELYDLSEDPGEARNLIDGHPDRAEGLRTALESLVAEQARSDREQTPDLASSERLDMIRSLGYVSGSAGPPSTSAYEPRGEDPKRFIDDLNRLLNATDLRTNGRFEEARKECLEVLRRRPGNLRALLIMGNVSVSQGQLEDAVEHYSAYLRSAETGEDESSVYSTLQMDADLAEVHYNLGNSLHRLGEMDRAAHHYAESIRLRGDFAQVHNDLGVLCMQLGKPRDAIEHFRRALAIDSRHRDARENLAMANAELQRRN